MKLVIVESPAKCKTISKYLGSDYKVIASIGHIRDLPSKDHSVDTDNNFKMHYQIKPTSKKYVDEIVSNAKKSEKVFLASDPDREGEAIAWNIKEVLKEKKAVSDDKIFRISFSQITASALKYAVDNARNIDDNLVESQQARLCLDYLVGFSISPVLWRKLPGSRSAGRVQSVALRLIAEREVEIKKFVPTPYWSFDVYLESDIDDLKIANNKKKKSNSSEKEEGEEKSLIAKAISYNGNEIDNSFPKDVETADKIKNEILKSGMCSVLDVKEEEFKQNPQPPFITSTLQQEASRKLGFSSKKTMQIAQKLYEGMEIDGYRAGLITYMRTDGYTIANDVLKDIRNAIEKNHGSNFLPDKPVYYKTKVRNAQEAHEAIRPTHFEFTPKHVAPFLDLDSLKLYTLIWNRTLACQMLPAKKVTHSVRFKVKNVDAVLLISETRIKFNGFLAAYNYPDVESNGEESLKSGFMSFKVGQEIAINDVLCNEHFTSPPRRFNEASLIKKMEEIGIGRPSTYSSVVSIIQDRGYVELNSSKQFIALDRGMVVTAFLKRFFKQYVEYDFTAHLEEKLDHVSNGEVSRNTLLSEFWTPFHQNVESALQIGYEDVSKNLNEELKDYLFSKDGIVDNKCHKCKDGVMSFNSGKFGFYLRCTRHPECDNTIALSKWERGVDVVGAEDENAIVRDGIKFTLKVGPYGKYIEVKNGDKDKKNVSIPKDVTDLNEETIVAFGSLPRQLGKDKDGYVVNVNVGRFGPYVSCNKVFASIKSGDIFNVTLDKALELINNKMSKQDGKSALKNQISMIHPTTKKDIKIGKSKYGVYALYEKKYHTIKDVDSVDDVSLEIAIAAIESGKNEKDAKDGYITKAKTVKKSAVTTKASKKAAKKATVSKTTKKAVKKSSNN